MVPPDGSEAPVSNVETTAAEESDEPAETVTGTAPIASSTPSRDVPESTGPISTPPPAVPTTSCTESLSAYQPRRTPTRTSRVAPIIVGMTITVIVSMFVFVNRMHNHSQVASTGNTNTSSVPSGVVVL